LFDPIFPHSPATELDPAIQERDMSTCRHGSILLALCAIAGLAPAVAEAQDNSANTQLQAAFANGQKLAAAGKHAEAVVQFERALKLAPSVFGANDVNTASIQGNLANSYNSLRKYDKAEPLYLKCLKTREARLGADSPVVAMTRCNLGDLYANSSTRPRRNTSPACKSA
jgi:tetratricopeptide (TPR) repeat protein